MSGNVEPLAFLHDRLACGEQALGVAVTGSGGQVVYHVVEDFIGGVEAEGGRVANIELQYLVAFLFQALGFLQHWSRGCRSRRCLVCQIDTL